MPDNDVKASEEPISVQEMSIAEITAIRDGSQVVGVPWECGAHNIEQVRRRLIASLHE